MIVLDLPYPVSNNKNARMVNGRMVISAEARAYKNTVGWIAKSVGAKVQKGDLCVTVNYKPRMNKDGSASKVRMDIDNVLKVMFDALNGIAWVDDSQIVKLIAMVDKPCESGGLKVIIEANT